MKRALFISVLLTGSLSLAAVDSKILGKWTGGCHMANPQETEFEMGTDEFMNDGSGIWTTEIFNNLQCNGASIRANPPETFTFQTTNNDTLDVQLGGATMHAHYEVVGDELRLSQIVMISNGKTYTSDGDTLKRVP